jgi:hypothetical protein
MSEPNPSPLAKSGDKLQEMERRAWVRYSSSQEPLWRFFGMRTEEAWPAKVHDISVTGIGLLIERPLKPRTMLTVNLRGRTHNLSQPMLVRVNHVTGQPDGKWLVGCSFINRLSDDDLQALL